MNLKCQIILEDRHILGANKPHGVPSQPDLTGDLSAWEFLQSGRNKKIHLMNRLDRPVSGALLFSKSSKANVHLTAQQTSGNIQKTYYAFVEKGKLNQKDILRHYMHTNKKTRKSYCSGEKTPQSTEVFLNYEVLEELQNYLLLRIILNSGKYHQIRSQLSFMGCPVKGDVKYGARRKNQARNLHLHARSLSFIHPGNNKHIQIEADLPENDTLWEEAKKFLHQNDVGETG